MAKLNKKALAVVKRGTPSVQREEGGNVLFNLFVPADAPSPKKMRVTSMSPLIKPANWPKDRNGNNMKLVGKFTKIFTTHPGNDDKGQPKEGNGVEIMPPESKVGVALPLTATLRGGLEVSGVGSTATSPVLGKDVEIQLLEHRLPSKQGNDAWHFIVGIIED
jgi:hypothetical protein